MSKLLNAAQRRALIGKKVMWKDGMDRHRGTYILRVDWVEETHGRNIKMRSGDWKWYPHLTDLREFVEGGFKD